MSATYFRYPIFLFSLFALINSSMEAGVCRPGPSCLFGHDSDCESEDACCWMNRLVFDAEYLYWGIKDSPAPIPLVVKSLTPPPFQPVLNSPGSEVVLGGGKIDHDWRSGGRFGLGYWFDNPRCYGMEISYLFLPNMSSSKKVESTGILGSQKLAFPFYDVTTSSESSTWIAYPGEFSGVAKLQVTNNMQGVELNGLYKAFKCTRSIVNLFGGFRYWNFNERLTFTTDSPYIAVPEDFFVTRDRFHAKNNFFGGQLGASLDYQCQNVIFNLKGKIALGAMCEETVVRGKLLTNDFNDFGDIQKFEGGYLALPTNIGHHKRTQFAYIPEVNVNLGYCVTDHFLFKVGYSFTFVSKVLRAANQLSRDINPSQAAAIVSVPDPVLIGQKSPQPLLNSTSFWIQGINVGFEYDF